MEKSTYNGDVNGVIGDAEKEEIKIWKEKGYVKPEIPRTRIEDSVGQGGKNDKPDVICVQKKLMELGYEVDSANSDCDEKTIKAIKMFQIGIKKFPRIGVISFPDGLIEKGKGTDNALFGSSPITYEKLKPVKGTIKTIHSRAKDKKAKATGKDKEYWDGIETVWNDVSPYLPEGSNLYSGYRSEKYQREILHNWFNNKFKKEIIEEYGKNEWQKYHDMQGKNNKEADPKMCSMIRKAKQQAIAVPGTSKHERGRAIDIGGTNDNQQVRALLWFNNEYPGKKRVVRIIKEDNGFLHFEF